MTGNVWEWCWDYEGTITASVPEHGPISGTHRRNVRGSGIEFLNERHGNGTQYSDNGAGFRVVRNAE